MTTAAAEPGLLFYPGTLPFTVALMLMGAIGILEVLSIALGLGLSNLIDGALPDFDFDADADLDGVHSHPGFLDALLGWLHFGSVPALILFVTFLAGFGVVGLTIQGLVHGVTSYMLPSWLAAIPAFLGALPIVRVTGGILARILPKDETDAVSSDSFVGRIATVGQATATVGSPAQAKLRDEHGHTHYVLVEPDMEGETLAPGTEVLVVRKSGAKYYAIRNTNPALSS